MMTEAHGQALGRRKAANLEYISLWLGTAHRLGGEERMRKPFPPIRKSDGDITHLRMDFGRIGLSIGSRSKDHM